jgi:aminopeptidase N
MTEHLIRREDYRPPQWSVREVWLSFTLGEETTEVRARLHCVRGKGVSEEEPIVLDAEALELISVTLDGEPLSPLAGPGERGFVYDESGLRLYGARAPETWVETVVRIHPARNTALSGLYRSGTGLFTQCEAQGFRRITPFPDRPDVMARFHVTLEADEARYPVLLSNGNLVEKVRLPGGRHRAVWVDPFPKPCYLFALVAADLQALEREVGLADGRRALLQVWVKDEHLPRADWALVSLEAALRWDERRFGRVLDLDRYMIVAVSDFNMGAMENKGLNIFNTKYVLASPETATDADYAAVQAVVGHEYFHNWTGNRITCRDWFQLTLKEGLTVFREQEFSADQLAQAVGPERAASARAVKRIEDVQTLRTVQFPEDEGPMAHPIRPQSYRAIDNFYTATVYEKGAEVIRLLHTLLGEAGFRAGMDRYFERYDGQAVTCEDFVAAMAEANGVDLTPFLRWYEQAGTPRLVVEEDWDGDAGRYTLRLRQFTPPTPGQPEKGPVVLPIRLGLLGADGRDLPLVLADERDAVPAPEAPPAGGMRPIAPRDTAVGARTRLFTLTGETLALEFVGLPPGPKPVPSLLRGFSAPVRLMLDEPDEALRHRMAYDSDAFNRWDAAQSWAQRQVLRLARGEAETLDEGFVASWRQLLADESLDAMFRVKAAALPSERWLLEAMTPADPVRLRAALVRASHALARAGAELWPRWRDSGAARPYRYDPLEAGRRALAAFAWRMEALLGEDERCSRAFAAADNLTERLAALDAALTHPDEAVGEALLSAFESRYAEDDLVLDKWFARQAMRWSWHGAPGRTLERVRRLADHRAFRWTNPNKVYALVLNFFANNLAEACAAGDPAWAFWQEAVLRLDATNPIVGSRLARALERWRRWAEPYRDSFAPVLEATRRQVRSAEVREILERMADEAVGAP